MKKNMSKPGGKTEYLAPKMKEMKSGGMKAKSGKKKGCSCGGR
jgi:hypothetical protein